ncbi:MAG: prepilin-type N-terminal cleavage/methylation domain-containing protein [Desulfovibrio sp.]|uniref:prepilin-type N-terminal cleavage/methylation domain-containing protein n=1 Tax=Desulfovibrio sp. 7SRBS1 TaxID=3378064 RepID=UPI003B40902D
MKTRRLHATVHSGHSAGFTLIELVLTIVVIAILAAAAVPYITEGTAPVVQSVARLKDSLLLNAVMENIIVDFEAQPDAVQAVEDFHQSHISNTDYGEGLDDGADYPYQVIENNLIRFANGGETSSGVTMENCDGVRLTIASSTNQGLRLTYFFPVD